MAFQQRGSTRHKVSLPISVTVGERRIEATTQNLALGGTCVALGERLTIGTRVALSFRVPTCADPIAIEGEVRWSSDGGTGIQFAALRARQVWELNEYFESLAR